MINLKEIEPIQKLNKQQLTEEKRFGIIEFSIDFLFHFGALEEYIIPIRLFTIENKILMQENKYALTCLSPHFDKIGDLKSVDDMPHYKITVCNAPLEEFRFEKL